MDERQITQTEHARWMKFFRSPERFRREQIDDLRSNLPAVLENAAPNHAHARELRIALEQIDMMIDLHAAIEKLDKSSTRLVTTTNRLTWAILFFTIVAAGAGLLALR